MKTFPSVYGYTLHTLITNGTLTLTKMAFIFGARIIQKCLLNDSFLPNNTYVRDLILFMSYPNGRDERFWLKRLTKNNE